MQRTVNAEAKIGLRSSTIVHDLDAGCLENHRLSQNISSKVQTHISKDSFRPEKLKAKDPKSAPLYKNTAELAKKENEKNKSSKEYKREHIKKWKK